MTVDPVRVVADADVLAADLLVGGPDREALDALRAHSWTTLVASDPLLDDAEAVIAALGDDALATDWRARIADWATIVDHPPEDHPALSCAVHGEAAHILTHDPALTSAETGARLHRLETSAKPPAAFARRFDPATLYAATVGGEYPGPDRDPRA
ncbi:MAG: hypothetical protein ABEJ57_00475 [Halobacteriaceae archaeon]